MTAPDYFDSLTTLALDLRSSWNHSADELWRQLDPMLWNLTHNPWVVLQTVSRDRIDALTGDAAFRQRIDALLQARQQAVGTPAWFQTTHGAANLTAVAYFSMEFMLSEALPIYSGGLGNVAGDQLKAASDLGVPVIGVGLLYSQGYFRQLIDDDGAQQAVFPYNDPGQLPITPLRRTNGEWLRLRLDLLGCPIWLRAWKVQVGRAQLYLLDSNDAANYVPFRAITSELYGGGPELRLMQELVLGIGGWRLLEAIDARPHVCHLNEGHAAFAVLERARSFMRATGQPFDVALTVTRAGNVFTTHTAVAAGFDRYPVALIEKFLGRYATEELGLTLTQLLELGRCSNADAAEEFNMAYLAFRGSGAVNGVSRLHEQVSQRLFQPLFPRWPAAQLPIGHVTNGVHAPSWDSAAADTLWTEACGKARWLGAIEGVESSIRQVPDARLWQLRLSARRTLIDYVREVLARQLAAAGASPSAVQQAKGLFGPHIMTLGFARRFATYKRPNLLLHDPERLLRLLLNRERPVQLVIAGKAHPADKAGQALIQQWIRFIRRSEAREHVIFLSDYDMLVTEQLVQGVDVWLNTPRRPWEASGTSGMKVLVNGGINVSELDGWWAEAYAPEVGWALGDGREHGDDPLWDAAEADALYTLLETVVTSEFYLRDANGIPGAWVARMRESMARLTPHYSTNRVVREYTEQFYLPASAAYRARAAEQGASGIDIVSWQRALRRHWEAIRFGTLAVHSTDQHHDIEVQLYLGELDPQSVCVQLYADASGGGEAFCSAMERVQAAEAHSTDVTTYRARICAARPASDYTPRVIPCHANAQVPLEAPFIAWQR